MANYAPQHNLFTIIDRIRKGIIVIFWIIFFLSVIPVLIKFLNIQINLDDLVSTINIVSISLFFVLEIIVEYIMIPLADSKRRDDFIDNAFGSTFSPAPSVGYYDTDEIQIGIYKAACNLFENSYFTFSLAKAVTVKKIVLPALVLVSIMVFAYYGFKQVPFALSLLQALFSATLLGDLIKHIILLTRLNSIHDAWINLFQHPDLKSNILKYQPHIYRYWLQYEALHSRIPSGISDSVFKKHNQELTDEWNNLKIRYNIN
jgi:hypothetical protein